MYICNCVSLNYCEPSFVILIMILLDPQVTKLLLIYDEKSLIVIESLQ